MRTAGKQQDNLHSTKPWYLAAGGVCRALSFFSFLPVILPVLILSYIVLVILILL